MAVELDLNRYVAQPSPTETTQQRLERRNRERTYLILFVHDRSLSTQTGKPWMLQECDLVRNSNRWHEHNGAAPSGEDGDAPIRPEDVILASFVQLRRIVVGFAFTTYYPSITELFYVRRRRRNIFFQLMQAHHGRPMLITTVRSRPAMHDYNAGQRTGRSNSKEACFYSHRLPTVD